MDAHQNYGKKSDNRRNGGGYGGGGGGPGGPGGPGGGGGPSGGYGRGPRGMDNVRGIDHSMLRNPETFLWICWTFLLKIAGLRSLTLKVTHKFLNYCKPKHEVSAFGMDVRDCTCNS